MSPPQSDEPPSEEPPKRPFQFSLAAMLGITAMVSVLAAAFGGMWRAHGGDLDVNPNLFRLMAILSPLGMLILVSLFHASTQWLKRRR